MGKHLKKNTRAFHDKTTFKMVPCTPFVKMKINLRYYTSSLSNLNSRKTYLSEKNLESFYINYVDSQPST